MRIRSFVMHTTFALTVVLVGCLIGASPTSFAMGQGSKPGSSGLSADEQTMLKAIVAAPDPATRLKAVEALLKKHPKTTARERVARETATEIATVKDDAQRLTLAQQYALIFTEPSEQQMIGQTLISALVAAKRFDEAFAAGAEFLKGSPDSLDVLVQLVTVGTDQAKQKNPKFIPQTLPYAAHAIELLEGDKKPADMDDAGWKQYKGVVLPSLYQSMGLLNFVKGDRAEAKVRFNKAAAAAPADPFNYLLLAGILNDEYQDGAVRYKNMPAGPAKDEELKKLLALLDQVIDTYAHMIALAEGNERLQPIRQQYLQDLEAYYKYRHNSSTEGMQQLIDKYKLPAKP
jgi:hypothetical protein